MSNDVSWFSLFWWNWYFYRHKNSRAITLKKRACYWC